MWPPSSALHNAGSSHLCVGLQFTFLQDDVGVPLNYRHMEGFGVHTYTLINKDGRVTYVKFHWQPALGALTSHLSYISHLHRLQPLCAGVPRPGPGLLILISNTQIMTDQIRYLERLGAKAQSCQLNPVYEPF